MGLIESILRLPALAVRALRPSVLRRSDPRRLGLLIGALLVLSTTVAVASDRYPEDVPLTRERAARVFEDEGYEPLSCGADLTAEYPCVELHLTNFTAKARVIGAAFVVALGMVLIAMRPRYDSRRS
ncbi:MAG TPA: hypothetical protein VGB83_05365 [Actinomycetota bacterium]